MKSLSVMLTLLLFQCLWAANSAIADEVSDMSAPKVMVKVDSWLGEAKQVESSKNYAVSEQVILHIDVSTPRWFLGPTTIGKIDIPNLIVKQRNQLATNYTQREGGVTWSHQRWEITLYPQSSGTFRLPQIPVSATIAGDEGQKVQKSASTSALSFKALLPDGQLTDNDKWFAASKVAVEQNWQTSHEQLKVGDAITRTLKITADDSLSILLPKWLEEKSTSDYQAYSDPAKLVDKSVRGDYLSSREDKVVYVMQKGGEVTFPSFTITWWNTKNQALETIHIEGKSFQVKHTLSSFIQTYWLWLVSLVLGLMAIVIFVFGVICYYRDRPLPLFIQFHRSVFNNNVKTARLLLYIKLKKVMQKDAFFQVDELQSLTEGVADPKSGSKQIKSYWKRIKANNVSANSPLQPLKLKSTLDKIVNK